MDLTESYRTAVPQDVLNRYDWAETRNAAAIIAATNQAEFSDIVEILRDFHVDPSLDIFPSGGNESMTAGRLNRGFRGKGWRETSYKVTVGSTLQLLPWRNVGETAPLVTNAESDSTSYLVDNVKGRIACDVEWHAKDGNLDRDVAAYRSLHAETIIDAAAMVTMTRADLRAWAARLDPTTTKFQTATTTNLEKLRPRLIRGDGGGCPILVAAICGRTI